MRRPLGGAPALRPPTTSQGASTQNPSNDEPRASSLASEPGVTSTQKGTALVEMMPDPPDGGHADEALRRARAADERRKAGDR